MHVHARVRTHSRKSRRAVQRARLAHIDARRKRKPTTTGRRVGGGKPKRADRPARRRRDRRDGPQASCLPRRDSNCLAHARTAGKRNIQRKPPEDEERTAPRSKQLVVFLIEPCRLFLLVSPFAVSRLRPKGKREHRSALSQRARTGRPCPGRRGGSDQLLRARAHAQPGSAHAECRCRTTWFPSVRGNWNAPSQPPPLKARPVADALLFLQLPNRLAAATHRAARLPPPGAQGLLWSRRPSTRTAHPPHFSTKPLKDRYPSQAEVSIPPTSSFKIQPLFRRSLRRTLLDHSQVSSGYPNRRRAEEFRFSHWGVVPSAGSYSSASVRRRAASRLHLSARADCEEVHSSSGGTGVPYKYRALGLF